MKYTYMTIRIFKFFVEILNQDEFISRLKFEKNIFTLFVFHLVTTNIWAQNNDFCTWSKLKIRYKVNPLFTVFGDMELRTKYDASNIDRWGINFGGNYCVSPILKLETSYEWYYRNIKGKEWGYYHRYTLGGIISYSRRWFKVLLRERLQQTFKYSSRPENRLRSLLKFSYIPPKKYTTRPYFSIETFQSINEMYFWKAICMHYRLGVELSLSRVWDVDLFCCHQYSPTVPKNIAGIEFAYSF